MERVRFWEFSNVFVRVTKLADTGTRTSSFDDIRAWFEIDRFLNAYTKYYYLRGNAEL
jgi:hypothetical protein